MKTKRILDARNEAALRAAEQMDWVQVVLNGGPPCFHMEGDGKFCGRAERWEGHDDHHKFFSLADLIISLNPLTSTKQVR